MQYARILLPVDNSQEAVDVVDHAISVAGSPGASIHILYVIDETKFTDPAPLIHSGIDAATDELLAQYRKEGEKILASIADSIAEKSVDIDTLTALEQGVPYEEICSYARREDMDAIVMATHQRPERDRQLLGSVTERVIRTSDVPVFVVPPARNQR